jgi:predicted phage-related endonuclease
MRTRLDGKVKGKPIAYEAKTSRMPFDWGETIPPYYVPQVQHHLAVTGYDACRVVAMIGGSLPLKTYTVERDDRYIRDLIEVESEFWFKNCVEKIAPEPDGIPAAEEFIRRRHPAEKADTRVATPEETILVRDWHAARATLDAQERVADELRQRIMARIGDAAGIDGPGFKITWKKNKDSSRTGWEEVALSLKRMIDEATRDGRFEHRPGDPGYDEIVGLYTVTKEGPRVFRATIEEIA